MKSKSQHLSWLVALFTFSSVSWNQAFSWLTGMNVLSALNCWVGEVGNRVEVSSAARTQKTTLAENGCLEMRFPTPLARLLCKDFIHMNMDDLVPLLIVHYDRAFSLDSHPERDSIYFCIWKGINKTYKPIGRVPEGADFFRNLNSIDTG